MALFIVRIAATVVDKHGMEQSQIAQFPVPVEAGDETEACQRAVLWHGDNGTAAEDDDLLWKCDDLARLVSFKATKCLAITEDEMDTFLSLTQGVSSALVIGRPATAHSRP